MINKLLSENSSWEKLKASDKPIVLYGTGNGADAVLNRFESLGIKVAEVVASEGFVRQRSFRGFTVRSISYAKEKYGDFLLCLGFATCIDEVTQRIRELCLRHQTIMPVVPVFGDTLFDREYLESHGDELEKSRSMLFDQESKAVFDGMVKFQFTGELPILFEIESTREAALRDILKLTTNENILDLGAYRGDTIEEIEKLFGGYSSAVAFEPDKKSFEKLCAFADTHKNITPLPFAAWDKEAEFEFFGGGGRQSTLYGKGKYTVRAIAADDVIKERPITYVKIDVEGAEVQALRGIKKLLLEQKPKLSIAAYHRTEDLAWLIPLLKELNPEYKIYLRHHPYIPCWDTNLYCI